MYESVGDILELVEGTESLKVNGFDDCIVGVTPDGLLVYDSDLVVQKLQSEGMTKFEAWEYFAFNISGAYMGKGTPIFMERINGIF